MSKWRWAGAALALSVAVGAMAAGPSWGDSTGSSTTTTTTTTNALAPTPVLSVRRDPAWIEATLAAQRLQAALAPVVGVPLGQSSGVSACVEVSQGSTVLYSFAPDRELLPASDMKLVTDAALLDDLGPAYRLTTKVVSARSPSGGVLHGDLYLVGGGDPLLMTDAYVKSAYIAGFDPSPPIYTSLDQLAAQVKQAGIRVVTGSVLGDDSRFDEQRSVPSWQPVYISEGDVAPLSALEVDDDIPPPPPKTATTTTTTTAPPNSQGKNSPPQPVPPPDPPQNAATIFASLLRQEGIDVEGGATVGSAPTLAALVTQIQSPPLSAEIQSMLRISDDTAAELLTKELGYVESHSGTTSAGTAAVRADLKRDGLDVDSLVDVDGSGLDRGDRATCNLIDQVLTRAGPNGVMAAGLPIAGRTGTLVHRLVGSDAAGRLAAKTGTLEDVASLSGFITAPPSAPTSQLKTPLVFSIIVNGPSFAVGQDLIDRIAVALATYPNVPALAEVEAIP